MPVQVRRCAFLVLWTATAVLVTGCSEQTQTTAPEPPAIHQAVGTSDQHTTTPAAVPAHPTAAEEPPAAPNQVVIDSFRFQPRQLTVARGTRVTWVNRDDVPHTATSTQRPRSFDSGTLDSDDRFSHVFTTAGTYEYFCAVHPHMTGKIIVK